MLYGSIFEEALQETLSNEGIRSDHPLDPGGDTYMGISSVYWPDWNGWVHVHQGKEPPMDCVRKFYRSHFWNRVNGSRLADIDFDIAKEVFDSSVNLGVFQASTLLQEGLNLLNRNQLLWEDLMTDGKIGPASLKALENCQANGKCDVLLKLLNHLQAEHYIKLMRKYREKEEFSGWFQRT